MANAIQLKRSSTAGAVPSALADGEVAVQQADGVLFWRDAAQAVQRLLFPKRSPAADAAYAIKATDTYIGVSALTAARTLTLPAASAYPAGHILTVADEKGACSASLTVTLSPAGSDTVNGAASLVLSVPNFNVRLSSDGAAKWVVSGRGVPLLGDASGATVALSSGATAGTLANQLATMPVSPAQQSAINAAQSSAISSAASDATSKASTAQSNAIAASLQRSSNLSDLGNAGTARANLGLGGAATLSVGTAAGTVAAGNDARLNGALPTVQILPAATQTGSFATALFNQQFSEQYTAGAGFALGHALLMTRTGGTGHREAVHVEMISNATPAGFFNVGGNFIGHLTGGSGSCFGLNAVGWVDAGIASTAECSAFEANTVVKATCNRKTGIQIVDSDGSTASGTVFDAGLLLATNGTGIGYSIGIQFGAGAYTDGRDLGILANGTLIGVKATSKTLRAGLDLAGVTSWGIAPILLNAGGGKGLAFGGDLGGGAVLTDTTANGHRLRFANAQTVLQNSAGGNIVAFSDGGAISCAGVTLTTPGSTRDVSGMSVTPNASATAGTLARLINDLGGSVNLSASGYYRAPNGLILQWTSINLGSTADQSFSWPIAFPNALLGHANAIESADTATTSAWTLKMDGVTKTGGNVRARVTNNGGTTGQAAGTTIARLLSVGY